MSIQVTLFGSYNLACDRFTCLNGHLLSIFYLLYIARDTKQLSPGLFEKMGLWTDLRVWVIWVPVT